MLPGVGQQQSDDLLFSGKGYSLQIGLCTKLLDMEMNFNFFLPRDAPCAQRDTAIVRGNT